MQPYQLGQFDYDECFLGIGGFLTPEANEEKHMMSFYLQELAAELRVMDAFSGAPLATERCDFALLSHFIYHAKNVFHGRPRTDAEIDGQVQAHIIE